MKYLMIMTLSILFFLNPAFADERETLFEGFDAKIVSIVDDMTDEKSGIIFLDFDEIYMAIYNHNKFIIWSTTDNLNFAFDNQHLIRVGKNKPFFLQPLNKREGLVPISTTNAEVVIKSLIRGEELKLRYYDWPRYNKIDKKLRNPNFSFIYHKAAILFGWKNLGASSKLPPVKLEIYIPTDSDSKGYVDISVIGNKDLGLNKGFDKYGGGAHISVGILSLFGMQQGAWTCGQVDVSNYERKKIIIRNSKNEIIFQKTVPNKYGLGRLGNFWPHGKEAAKAALAVAPLGSIEIENHLYGKKVILYGFKELWEWGVNNANFPNFVKQ